jgi:hypothetical protein
MPAGTRIAAPHQSPFERSAADTKSSQTPTARRIPDITTG